MILLTWDKHNTELAIDRNDDGSLRLRLGSSNGSHVIAFHLSDEHISALNNIMADAWMRLDPSVDPAPAAPTKTTADDWKPSFYGEMKPDQQVAYFTFLLKNPHLAEMDGLDLDTIRDAIKETYIG